MGVTLESIYVPIYANSSYLFDQIAAWLRYIYREYDTV